ncbi:MAG: exodeoxyribonuclease VII large subunit [Verrucomicrobia bacterium]|nr:MAG: exodeoxyribonuclease VII large subunit [Verrucomicrobiota bacterium]
MPKTVKSQWDFGELFPPEPLAAARKVLSVTELTVRIRRLLEEQVGQVWVTGEITNLRHQSSGHIYFTLKDAGAQLSCVLFRGEMQVDRSLLQDGRKVTLQGEVTVYEPRGQYQLRVTAAELQGLGALQAAFEKLKQKLKAEGLFASERKRPLPRYPRRIGLVTSPTGAAVRDVLHVVQRRNPAVEIILAPCRVQGEGAAEEIAGAIRLLNEFNLSRRRREEALTAPRQQRAERDQNFLTSAPTARFLDLILVTRGGGSLEDLWAFNEEVVARAIFESVLPVVSAVGHEIDFTISDFVADVRAATPSAAAEIITEGVYSSVQFLSQVAGRMGQLARQQVQDKDYVLTQLIQRLARVHPRRRFDDWLQRLDDLQASLLRCVRQGARQQRTAWRNLAERLSRVRPALLVRQRREVFAQARRRLREQAEHRVRECKARLTSLDSRLRLLGPEQVLARGYSITTDAQTGKVLREAKEVKAGQRLKTRLKKGEVQSIVEM